MSDWDDGEDPPEELRPTDCDGTEDCPAAWHVHGCHADGGGCTEPHEHTIAASNHYQRPEYCQPSINHHVTPHKGCILR